MQTVTKENNVTITRIYSEDKNKTKQLAKVLRKILSGKN